MIREQREFAFLELVKLSLTKQLGKCQEVTTKTKKLEKNSFTFYVSPNMRLNILFLVTANHFGEKDLIEKIQSFNLEIFILYFHRVVVALIIGKYLILFISNIRFPSMHRMQNKNRQVFYVKHEVKRSIKLSPCYYSVLHC